MGRADDLAERFQTESQRLAGLEVRSRMTGRWMMAAIQTTFAVMPALVYLFARLDDLARLGLDHDRHARRVHDAADASVLPDRQPARRPARGAELAGALRPDLRVPRPAGRHRRGDADDRAAARRRRLRRRLVRLRGEDAWTLEDVDVRGPGRDEDGARRRDGLRQDDVRLSRRAALRRDPGHGDDRRDRRPRARPSRRSRRRSASSRRRRISSTRPSARTSASRGPTRPTRRSRRRRAPRRSTS